MATTYSPFGASKITKTTVRRRPPVNPASAQFGEIRSAIKPKPAVSPAPSPAPANPYGFNIQAGPKENVAWGNTIKQANQLPMRGDMMQDIRNPASSYGGAMPGANSYMNDYFGGGQREQYSRNPYGEEAMDYIRNAGGVPGRPDLMGPGSYNRPSGPSFNYGNADVGMFDPNSVGGFGDYNRGGWQDSYGAMNDRYDPNSVAGPNAWGDFSGPQTQNFDYNALIRQGGGGMMNTPTVGRENVQMSNFQNSELFGNPNSVANRGFDMSLRGASDMQNASLNTDIFKQQTDALKGELGALDQFSQLKTQEGVGSRGFLSDPSTAISQDVYAAHYAQPAAALKSKLVDFAGQNIDRTIDQRKFGTQTAADLGSRASDAARGNAGLLQSDSQWFGDSQLAQRGQDIDQRGQSINQAGQNQDAYGRNLSGVADLMRASGDMYRAGTERGTAQANIGLEGYGRQTERGAQFGNLWNEGSRIRTDDFRAGTERSRSRADSARSDYEAGTSRRQVEGDIYNTGRSNQNTRFGMETDRAGMENAARQAANELGFNYDQMDEQSKDWFNSQINQRYQTEGSLANERFRDTNTAFGNQTQMLSDRESAYYNRNLERDLGMASHALEVMKGDQQGQQAYNEMAMAARDGDINTAIMIYQMWIQDQQEGKQRRDATRGGIAGALIGAGGQVAGAYLGRTASATKAATGGV